MPFIEQGVPSIDLIDFDFACFHKRCDDLSAVSERSLDVTGKPCSNCCRVCSSGRSYEPEYPAGLGRLSSGFGRWGYLT